MVATLTALQTTILGAAIVELLNGELTDETIAAVDSIKREDVPEPLNNMVGWMHGMSTYQPLRESQITSLSSEIRSAATEVLEQRTRHPVQWNTLYNILEQIMEGGDYDIRGNADMFAEAELDITDRNPAWAKPLLQHIRNSTTQGDELTLQLLDVLEEQIHKRREKLKK